MDNIDVFVSEVETSAKNLDCGFFLFTAKAKSVFGKANSITRDLTGAMMLGALKAAAKHVYEGMIETGMSEESAKTVVITVAKEGIMEAANADEA